MAESEKKVASAPAEEAPKKSARKKSAPKKESAPAEEAPAKKAPAKKGAKKGGKKTHAEIHEEWKKAHKAAKEAAKPTVHEAHAYARNVRVTPRKVRLVLDLVRGKSVNDALAMLPHLNKAAAQPVMKLIASAAANATNNFDLDGDLLYISEIQASDGIKMRRYLPRAKGSSSGMVRRTANIRVTVKERK